MKLDKKNLNLHINVSQQFLDTTTLQWYKFTPFLIPPKLKLNYQASDFGVNNQRSLPPSIPRLRWDLWARHRTPNCSPGAVEIWLPTAAGVCLRCVCVHYCVCVCTWMGWMQSTNSKYGSPYLATHHFTFTKLICAWLSKSFYSRLFSEWGTIQGRFC